MSGPGDAPQPQADPLTGQITAELMDSMKAKIENALEATSVSVTDVSGDGRHVAIDVVSPRFDGLGSMKRLLPHPCFVVGASGTVQCAFCQ